MGLFSIIRQPKTEVQLQRLNSLLAASFANVKRDTGLIFQWLNFLYAKNQEQQRAIDNLTQDLSKIPKDKADFKKIIDDIYSFEDISKRMDSLNLRLDAIYRREIVPAGTGAGTGTEADFEAKQRLESIQKRLEKLEEKKQTLKEKLVKKITKNSKEYVKTIILSYIKKYEKISALQLKEMVVDEQGLCSKSSFYRLLEELESLEEISVIKKGKEKHYLSKLVKKI